MKLSAWALCYGFVAKSMGCQNLDYNMLLVFLHNHFHYFFCFALFLVLDDPDRSLKTVKNTQLLGATEEDKDAVQQQAWELSHLLS